MIKENIKQFKLFLKQHNAYKGFKKSLKSAEIQHLKNIAR